VASVGLSAVSLVNYACKGLCIVCLASHDELLRVLRGSVTAGGLCAMHILMPQDRTVQNRVCVSLCAATGCLSTAPAYLFTHSAVDKRLRVGKEASSLLYCWDFELIFVYSPDFDRLFLWALVCAVRPFNWPATNHLQFRLALQAKFGSPRGGASV